MSENGIPLIDIENLFDDSVIEKIHEACKNWGFFYISNHQVSADLIEKFRSISSGFFLLPKEKKKLVERSRENSRGYFDSELTKTKLDWKEGFDYGAQNGSLDSSGLDGFNQWPNEPENFEEIMRQWFSEMEKLSELLMRAIAKSFNWDLDTFKPYFHLNHTSLARINYYPKCPHPDTNKGVHEHTDAGALTVLLQDDNVSSLYVKKENMWMCVPPIKGTFVINIGDMMQIWTNDRFKSPLHRVESNKNFERYSVPFFYNPSYSTDVVALNLDKSEQAKYKPVNWGYFRSERYKGDYANYGEEIQITQLINA